VADGVRGAVAALPDGQRHAVALFYLAGLTHAEVADRLGVRVGAVKTRLHKARERLRRELTDTRPERTMPDATTTPLPMRIADLRRTADDGAPPRHVVFLEDERGKRVVPIWIGPTEATALAVLLEDVELPRPSPYQLSVALLRAAGAAIDEVRINRLAEAVFYAEVRLAGGAAVDARPSDALALALVSGAPILVDRAVLEEAARHEPAIAEDVARARIATDDGRTIAGEERARLEANARELAEFVARAGEQP
jgi:bifunctional DNase/RNase